MATHSPPGVHTEVEVGDECQTWGMQGHSWRGYYSGGIVVLASDKGQSLIYVEILFCNYIMLVLA